MASKTSTPLSGAERSARTVSPAKRGPASARAASAAAASAAAAPAPPLAEDHRWHLAQDAVGIAITDLEYAVMRTHQSFLRWQSECINAVCDTPLSGQENALLHIIHLRERPKTIKDLLQISNRQDVPNMQYELRKLLKAGLIDKYGSARNGVFYVTTERGAQVCEDFARVRAETLLALAEPLASDPAVHAARHLEQLEKAYESATREITTFRRR